MEKILLIDEKPVKFKSTGALLYRYKAQFRRDAMKDIFKLAECFDEESGEITDIEALDLETFYNLVWTLAKTADPTIPPPMEWLDTFSEFPLMEILPEVVEMITGCMTSNAELKKK